MSGRVDAVGLARHQRQLTLALGMREDGAVTQVRYIARSRLGRRLCETRRRQARAVSAGLPIRSGKPGNRRLAFA